MSMKKIIVILCCAFSELIWANAYISLESENYSEALRVYDLVKEEANDVQDGEIVYTHSRFELGGSFKGFGAAYLQRLDGELEHASDVALIYYYEKQDARNIQNRIYDYSVKVSSLASKGVTVFYAYEWQETAWLKLNIDVAETTYLNEGALNGKLNYSDDQLSASAQLNWSYEKDALFKRNVKAAKGELFAASFIIGAYSKIGSHQLKISDLYHQVEWENAPYTNMQANTDRVGGVGDDGKLSIRPLGSGVEGYKDVSQSLDPRYYFTNIFTMAYGDLLLDVDYVADIIWPRVGYALPFLEQKIALKYSLDDSSVFLAYEYADHFNIYLNMDDVSYKKAHRIDLGFKVSVF